MEQNFCNLMDALLHIPTISWPSVENPLYDGPINHWDFLIKSINQCLQSVSFRGVLKRFAFKLHVCANHLTRSKDEFHDFVCEIIL